MGNCNERNQNRRIFFEEGIISGKDENDYLKNKKENNSLKNDKENSLNSQIPEIIKENDNLINQNIIVNENENINLQNRQLQNENNIILENTFPKGTKYEKELSSNFKYFNIYWHAPNKTSDIHLFEKCFQNVKFYKGETIKTAINFFNAEFISEWIVITPGFEGKELIQKLEKFNFIKTFFIYCDDIKLHESWTKNNKKVGCITSSPEILCKKLIELNKNYIIPNFNYNCNAIKSINLKLNKINFPSIEPNRKNKKYDYNNFCMKLINYLNSDEAQKDMEANIEGGNIGLNLILNNLRKRNNIGNIILDYYLKNSVTYSHIYWNKKRVLLSLYFSKCPYQLNYLSFKEVLEIFKFTKFNDNDLGDDLYGNIETLCQKIENNECILEEKEAIWLIQTAIIQRIISCLKTGKFDINNMINNCQIINYFRDIDFCLKVFISSCIQSFDNIKHKFGDQLDLALLDCDNRFDEFERCKCQINKEKRIVTEEEEKKMYNTLTIKDFIIIGNDSFHNKIKNIEKNIKANSLNYLNMENLWDFLKEKRPKGKKLATFFYFLIIELEEFYENVDIIYLLCLEYGLTILVLLYNENDEIIYYKNPMNFIFPTIFVNSPEYIINYLSQKFEVIYPDNNNKEELGELVQLKIPKITFEQCEEDGYENGCFELAETFDINIIKKSLVLRFLGGLEFLYDFCKDIYIIYKEHNALDLFCEQNCLYFGWRIYPCFFYYNICFIKRILYMYCREEKESQKSFYRIINDDLRSREPYKIYRYINLLALINNLIEANKLKHFEGKVYRATKLDENLILKLVPGVKMVNTTFWSTSKEFEFAEKFMKKHNWRNAYIICKTIKNNIDINFEKLNSFNEKEVLFLPFNEFIIEKVSSEIKYNRKIFTIELTEIGNKNAVNIDNMQILDVKCLRMERKEEAKLDLDAVHNLNIKINKIFDGFKFL